MNAAAHNLTDSAARPETLVYGLGSTGLSIARYLKRKGLDATYFDSRERPPGLEPLTKLCPDAEVLLGDLSGDRVQGFRRAIVSPGIPDRDTVIRRLRTAGVDIVSDIDLFVDAAEAGFIAVTGSNGKSTVTTLIGRMLQAAGIPALAGGNLGRPALDLLTDEVPETYVLELSSFQLQRVRRLPARIAVLLNVSADHLDWHRDLDEYRAAKHRIFDDAAAAVLNRDDRAGWPAGAAGLPTRTFGLDAPEAGQFGLRRQGKSRYLARGDERLIDCADIAMTGTHNWANALAALAACDLAGAELSAAAEVLRNFEGLPHRMQFVRELEGVRYINDSKATNVGAAIASVQSIDGGVVLLAGGQGKGGDFERLAEAVAARLRALVVFGEDAERIATAFAGRTTIRRTLDLDEAIHAARSIATAGDTVLLAPACASFDQFDNYLARGDAFMQSVGRLTA